MGLVPSHWWVRAILVCLTGAWCAMLACSDVPETTESGSAVLECTVDEDCTDGRVCGGGFCVDPATLDCTSNGDCVDGVLCVDGRCMTPPRDCSGNGGCTANETCQEGVCISSAQVADCTSNGECAQGQQCVSNRCVTPVSDCSANGDCADGELCQNDQCVLATPVPTVTVMEESTRAPHVVRFDLRLKDAQGDAIAQGVAPENFRIFEDGRLIDRTETNQFLTAGPNLPLKVVLVLDYSNSMLAAGAIEPMTQAAQQFVRADYFTATHHIGIVEFHDRSDIGEGFSTAVELTVADPDTSDGKTAIVAAIGNEDDTEHGLSRVWDAVDLAMDMLEASGREQGEFQAVVFLTDGHDTTSETTPDEILTRAEADVVTIYPIGFNPDAEDETTLRDLADQSAGRYFSAVDAGDLAAIFTRIIDDLRGQWSLTYITQRNSGTVEVNVEFDWQGDTVVFDHSFDAAGIQGDIHQGAIEVARRWGEPEGSQTHFLLSAAYVPRNVSMFRFRFTDEDATFALQGAGGLTDPDAGWTLTAAGDGLFELIGPEPLDYGAFGNIGTATVPGDVTKLQVSHDDTIYDTLVHPKTMSIQGESHGKPFSITVKIDPLNVGTIGFSPDKTSYAEGDVVTLTGIGSDNYTLGYWEGDATGTNATTTIVMDEDKEVTANFYPPRELTVTVSPATDGSVTKNPDQQNYAHGDIVTLTAQGTDNHAFDRWEGSATGTTATLSLTMDGDKSVTAYFHPERVLTIVISPAGAGTVTLSPNQTTYAHGTTVTLTAVPNGTTFTSWSGDATGSSTTVSLTMDGNKTVTATFN